MSKQCNAFKYWSLHFQKIESLTLSYIDLASKWRPKLLYCYNYEGLSHAFKIECQSRGFIYYGAVHHCAGKRHYANTHQFLIICVLWVTATTIRLRKTLIKLDTTTSPCTSISKCQTLLCNLAWKCSHKLDWLWLTGSELNSAPANRVTMMTVACQGR